MHKTLLFFLLIGNALAKYQLADISISMGSVTLKVENGANLYVQSNDDATLLEKIKITNNLSTMTALDVSKLGTNADQTKTAWPVKGEVTISSTNTALDAAKLSGFVYFTTYSQAQDNNFLVYSVDRNLSINYENADLTVVFLNQKIEWDTQNDRMNRIIRPAYVPQKSSRVYDYTFFQKSNISIYWDEPTETYKNLSSADSKNSRIFANPLLLDDDAKYFDYVEPFQIFNDIWYLRSSGHIKFKVTPKWDDPNGMTTSRVTTTGLVMCLYSAENVTINMLFNSSNSATSGVDSLYHVINPVTLATSGFSFGLPPQNFINRRAGSSQSMTTYITITSEHSDVGQFAVQYFQIEGDPLPTTTAGPTTTSPSTVTTETPTTTTVLTTTKSTSYLNVVFTVAIVIGLNMT